MGMSLEPGAGLGSKSGLFWRVPNMHESDDPRGKEAGDERLQVSDSLSETDPIPPNCAQDTGSICALIPPGGWTGVKPQVVAAVGHGDRPGWVDDLGPVVAESFDSRVRSARPARYAHG